MTNEEKQLLLKDLCARLPYGVIVEYGYKFEDIDKGEKRHILTGRMLDSYFYNITLSGTKVTSIKPYLRPMSSMTEEEEEELECKFPHLSLNGDDIYGYLARGEIGDFLEFIYSHHIDLNGLIPMGLALEAPEGMYNN